MLTFDYSCRRVDDRLDVFEGIIDNPWFLGVQAITFMGQIIIVFKGGAAFETEPLTGSQWGWSVLFGVLVIPVGAVVRLLPNRWFEFAGRLLQPLGWPYCALVRWMTDRKEERARRAEIAQQKQKKDVEAQPKDTVHVEEAGQWERQDRRRDWVKRMLGGDRRRTAQSSKPSQDVPLDTLKSKAGLMASPLPSRAEEEDSGQAFDLLAAIEASKYNVLEGSLPGLHVHPETQKDDPVLMMPPTLEQVLRKETSGEAPPVPPSQNWEVMRYVTIDTRSGRRTPLDD